MKPTQDSSSSFALGLIFLVLSRVVGALINCLADCDETFNYWEPLHYLLYGFGLQTWEYSPDYALRTYSYLFPHAVVGEALRVLIGIFTPNGKVFVFFGIRLILGLLSAYTEFRFCKAIGVRFGSMVSSFTMLFSTFSSGMFQMSTALLPSAFATTFVMLTYTELYNGSSTHLRGIFWAVVCVLCTGWPFVGVVFLPFALEVFFTQANTKGLQGVLQVIKWGLLSLIPVLAVSVALDTWRYNRLVWPTWNIIEYNVLNKGGGDTLYGVEPASYYIKNLVLNFNLVFLLVLCLPVMCCFTKQLQTSSFLGRFGPLWTMAPVVLWLGIMLSRPHKEERFLYPIYPFLCLGAALTLSLGIKSARSLPSSLYSLLPPPLTLVVLYGLISTSRVLSMTRNFNAPLQIGWYLHQHANNNEVVCMGAEWYRFPSHFFLGGSKLAFVPSHFKGQLPQYFGNDTWATPAQPFNEMNLEEPSRYISLSSCDWFVDPGNAFMGLGSSGFEWDKVLCLDLMDPERSPSPQRAFYGLPGVQFSEFNLYRNRRRN